MGVKKFLAFPVLSLLAQNLYNLFWSILSLSLDSIVLFGQKSKRLEV